MKVGRVLRAALGCAALLTGCLVPQEELARSAFNTDYNCPAARVQLKQTSINQYEASGCGRQNTYSCTDLGGCTRDRKPPTVTADDVYGKGKLFYSAQFEPDALLKISAWPEDAGHPVALSFATSDRDGCKLDLVVDGDSVELAPGRSGSIDLDGELFLSLRDARAVSFRGCGGIWQLASKQLKDLQTFAQQYAERLPDDARRGEVAAQRAKNAPDGGWRAWQGLNGFPNASLSGDALSGPQLFEKLSPSVLKVEVKRGGGYAQGSAVAVTRDSAVTNCHVLELARGIVVKQGGQEWQATLVESDPAKDRCILQVKGTTLTPVQGVRPFADLKVGEPLYTLGAPSGLDLTLTDGILSARREDGGVRYVQTTAPISPGSSGGGLFDAHGNLVGITTLVVVGEKHLNQSLNFAIAAEMFWSP